MCSCSHFTSLHTIELRAEKKQRGKMLDKLWDDVMAGPQPESGLDKLRNTLSVQTSVETGEGSSSKYQSLDAEQQRKEELDKLWADVMADYQRNRPGQAPQQLFSFKQCGNLGKDRAASSQRSMTMPGEPKPTTASNSVADGRVRERVRSVFPPGE
nr:auxin-repressed 12.5 kDa protein-like [Ipomoea batatas]